MDSKERATNLQLSSGISFQTNKDARLLSQNIRDLGSQFTAKMSQTENSPVPSREGFAFEYLDAMDQQLSLGNNYKVEVPDINGKNSPDIQIRSNASGRVIQEQQLKLSSQPADNAAKSGVYGKQEVRTPQGQSRRPSNPQVKESQVSRTEVSQGAKNPYQAITSNQIKAAIAEVGNAAAKGAITGAVAATLISGLEHFLAVERGEIPLDKAVIAVFQSTLEGAAIGAIGGGVFALIPALLPAAIPIMGVVSIPLLAFGAFQFVDRIGHIISHHIDMKGRQA